MFESFRTHARTLGPINQVAFLVDSILVLVPCPPCPSHVKIDDNGTSGFGTRAIGFFGLSLRFSRSTASRMCDLILCLVLSCCRSGCASRDHTSGLFLSRKPRLSTGRFGESGKFLEGAESLRAPGCTETEQERTASD